MNKQQRYKIFTILSGIGFIIALICLITSALTAGLIIAVLAFGAAIYAIKLFYDIKKENIAKAEKDQKEREEQAAAQAEIYAKRQKEIEVIEKKIFEERKQKYNSMPRDAQEIVRGIYIIPDGKEVISSNIKTTKVRGLQYYDVELSDLHKNEEVLIRHEPTTEYPENTAIVNDSDDQFGSLKKEMAEDFVRMYGENFELYGKITKIEKDEDYPVVMVEIYTPVFAKIKRG